MHVLPKGLMRIRHYGLLSNRCRKNALEVIRKILKKPLEKPEMEKKDAKKEVPQTYSCPLCHKGHLVFVGKLRPVESSSSLVPG